MVALSKYLWNSLYIIQDTKATLQGGKREFTLRFSQLYSFFAVSKVPSCDYEL